ncbi:hypothetical protein Tco_0953019 [Tanacetum coccineum]|uniref:Uncharacterized protein n=1 Tax=Tanacetum coccineum TaxID=301880 RepID=A0ABQ5E400_9ASTR
MTQLQWCLSGNGERTRIRISRTTNCIDRLVDIVLLWDGSVLVGTSVKAFPSSEGEPPLVYGEEVTDNCTETDAKVRRKKPVASESYSMNGSIEAVTATDH